MKTNGLRPVWDGLKKLKKLWVAIIIIVLLIVHMGIFILKDFSFGYRYYEFNQQMDAQVTVGYSKEKMNILSIMDEYLKQLEDEGYYIVSCNINKTIFEQTCIIPKHKINEDEIKKIFISSFDITVFCKKVTINKDVYYFKNETDKKAFIDKLNSIKSIEYNSEEVIENKSVITKQTVLDKKIDTLKKEKEEEEKKQKEKELKKKQKVTSRSGQTRRQQSSYSSGAPLATYSYISSYYGMRNGKMHTGVDFAAPAGTKIYAWKAGKVIQASWSGSYGNFIVIQHNDGTISRYAHCSGYACSKGDVVSKGQVIGYVGTTGNSTGNHLHLEIKINGNFVNPLNYL